MNNPVTKLGDGRYIVSQMIGTGGMADVYLGLDTRLDRQVAIKAAGISLAELASMILLISYSDKTFVKPSLHKRN